MRITVAQEASETGTTAKSGMSGGASAVHAVDGERSLSERVDVGVNQLGHGCTVRTARRPA